VTGQGSIKSDSVVQDVLERYGHRASSLISVLQDINRHFRYLPEQALR